MRVIFRVCLVRGYEPRDAPWWLTEDLALGNNINGEALLECDHSVLKELGIKKVGDRVRIFVAIKALRTKAYGNGKKRNRDILAALDNMNGMPPYRTPTQSPYHPSPSQSNKRYSRSLPDGISSTLNSNSYNRPDSPSDSEYPRSYQRNGGACNVISPPPESGRSNPGPPTPASGFSHPTKTPRTPYDYGKPPAVAGSPHHTKPTHRQSPSLDKGIMALTLIQQDAIKVIGDGGQYRVINISDCSTPETLMRKVIKKFGIMDHWPSWGIYNIVNENGKDAARCLSDAELLRIAHDVNRPERTRLILGKKVSPPLPLSSEFRIAQQTARAQQDTAQKNSSAGASLGSDPRDRPSSPMSASSQLSPVSATATDPASPRSRDSGPSRKASKKITAFFGQRPPSELISSNLAEYFPDHEHKVLERTVRNSIRRSTRMSRYNNRFSVATTRSYASSLSDAPPVPSVGDAWLNASPVSAMPNIPSRVPRPLSIRKSFLPSTSFSDNRDSLGAVPEDGESSPMGSERKSYMSFDGGKEDSVRDSVNVIVTDTDTGSTMESYLDTRSNVSTPATEVDPHAANMLDQFLSAGESEEEEEDGEGGCREDSWCSLRWMKGALIGAGSFGSVFLALNALTGELMAVKQVEMASGGKEDARKRSMVEALQREIELLKDLQHPNIVQYLGSSDEDDSLNIFLEYVPGGSVAALLNTYGPQKEPLIRNFVRQILTGLAYLHNQDIIHRDIKGANVLVDNKGGIKISDFGISKKVEAGLLTSSSHRPSLQGSVFWMAPEVVKQTSYTLKADIWSLGCLIVEMFTGTHPYPDCSQLQAIFKIGTGGSAPAIPSKCSAEAKQFLSRTFELDHVRRPTADELLLNPFLNPMVGLMGE
ncbi:Pkinase-domain-containing protein [Tuber magnatum]|uniref:mitogen-activated protein kinase n=1 Tax=Tuber magnatum TaxID=42249 RepID=A0A317SUH0_9PEZI|nr:Pkinase-domain-containing protein [Tuber magnatum]